ncbi:MAG: glycerol-3-phosphate acyltransferase [Candidatus Paceibacterota bacterium]|jgi:glycerol-3-phosphate acyltransferase PlsY
MIQPSIGILLIILLSFLLGSIPFALLINKLFFKTDLRKTGSKNMGALNTFRTASQEKNKWIGLVSFLSVFLLDAGKAILAIILSTIIAKASLNNITLAITLSSFFVVLGHNYSIFLKFKGGRGAASLLGILFYLSEQAFFSWYIFGAWLIIVLCFMILFEIIAGGTIKNNLFKNAISNQIIGRLIGEVVAVLWIYTISVEVFYPASAATILVLIAHKDRLAEQIKNIRNHTYLKTK